MTVCEALPYHWQTVRDETARGTPVWDYRRQDCERQVRMRA